MNSNVSSSTRRTSTASAVPSWRRSRYGFALFFALSLVAVFSALRALLFLQFKPDAAVSTADVAGTFLHGLERDVFVALLYTLPLLFWFLILRERWFITHWQRLLLRAGLFVFWFVQVFLLIAEYYFFDEFRSRFNTVAVDYLLYPHEVFINIWDSYPVPAVLAGCAVLSAAWVVVAFQLFRHAWVETARLGARFLAFCVALALCAALASTLNLKGAHFSTDRTLNEIADNGAIAFAAAWWTGNLDYGAYYKTMGKDEAYQRARRLLAEPGSQFTEENNSIRRRVAGDPARPRLNVVILMEESLGSEFWGCLGRTNTLTPEMDKLAAEEGMLFTNLYASGNRTVRGFEGVLSSFPPLPGESIVKRDRSDNVETIARVLKRDGYNTVFFYGGRGLFDGMRSYALPNGWDRFIEQKDFPHPTFATIWGVCDGDTYSRALEEFRELAKTGKPFLGTIMSVSNHKPYTYPVGQIPEDPNNHTRENAVKYSDYALGQFFKAAKQEPFWTNTVFVVVADHGARVYGSQSIPIHSYEIPLVILGPAVVKEPQRIGALGCSLDVSPTILGLIGRPYDTLFFGRDLLRGPSGQNRALLNHNRDIGLFAKERFAVLGLKQSVEFYAGDPKVAEITPLKSPTPRELELEKDAIAIYPVADVLYMIRRYHLDP